MKEKGNLSTELPNKPHGLLGSKAATMQDIRLFLAIKSSNFISYRLASRVKSATLYSGDGMVVDPGSSIPNSTGWKDPQAKTRVVNGLYISERAHIILPYHCDSLTDWTRKLEPLDEALDRHTQTKSIVLDCGLAMLLKLW